MSQYRECYMFPHHISPNYTEDYIATYGVESPCECLPGVGSFLANPGLSKEQLVPSCVVRTFILRNSSIGIIAQYQRSCEMKQL